MSSCSILDFPELLSVNTVTKVMSVNTITRLLLVSTIQINAVYICSKQLILAIYLHILSGDRHVFTVQLNECTFMCICIVRTVISNKVKIQLNDIDVDPPTYQ